MPLRENGKRRLVALDDLDKVEASRTCRRPTCATCAMKWYEVIRSVPYHFVALAKPGGIVSIALENLSRLRRFCNVLVILPGLCHEVVWQGRPGGTFGCGLPRYALPNKVCTYDANVVAQYLIAKSPWRCRRRGNSSNSRHANVESNRPWKFPGPVAWWMPGFVIRRTAGRSAVRRRRSSSACCRSRRGRPAGAGTGGRADRG